MTDPALCKLKGFDKLFFEAGKAEGRRLELLAMKKHIGVWCSRYGYTEKSIKEWLSGRLSTKPAKRKERANGK